MGNGTSIDIWFDSWLIHGEGKLITSTCPNNSETTKVCDFIDIGSPSQRTHLIDQLCNDIDKQIISSIPLNQTLP